MKIFVAILALWCSHECNAQFLQYFYTGIPGQQIYHAPPLIQPNFYYQPPALPQIQPVAQTLQASTPRPNARRPESTLPTNYRGFGYHTAYDDGGSATVVFFQGPGIESDFRNERITVGSDILDPEKAKNIEAQIRQTIEAQSKPSGRSLSVSVPNVENLAPVVRALFENPQPLNGLVHFYSAPGYPASTSPLALARSLNISTISNSTDVDQERQPAESIVNLVRVNKIEEDEKSSTTVETTSSANNVTETTSESTTDDDTVIIAFTEANEESVTDSINATDVTTISNNETTTSA